MTTDQRLQEAAHALAGSLFLCQWNKSHAIKVSHSSACSAILEALQSERREAERETWEAAARLAWERADNFVLMSRYGGRGSTDEERSAYARKADEWLEMERQLRARAATKDTPPVTVAAPHATTPPGTSGR